MSAIDLILQDKNDIQDFVEAVQSLREEDVDSHIAKLARGDEASWRRFIKGAYNHPITWWIGIFQLQMQMGIWGRRRKATANINANTLKQLLRPVLDEASLMNQAADTAHRSFGSSSESFYPKMSGPPPLISTIVSYNLKYRKADILGRLAGGQFTNYASTGGRAGNRQLNKTAKFARGGTNFVIASYGAALKALAEGYQSADAIIQSVLTGQPERLPEGARSMTPKRLTEEQTELADNLHWVLSEMLSSMANATPGPVPIRKFCSRPENVDLKGICE